MNWLIPHFYQDGLSNGFKAKFIFKSVLYLTTLKAQPLNKEKGFLSSIVQVKHGSSKNHWSQGQGVELLKPKRWPEIVLSILFDKAAEHIAEQMITSNLCVFNLQHAARTSSIQFIAHWMQLSVISVYTNYGMRHEHIGFASAWMRM